MRETERKRGKRETETHTKRDRKMIERQTGEERRTENNTEREDLGEADGTPLQRVPPPPPWGTGCF